MTKEMLEQTYYLDLEVKSKRNELIKLKGLEEKCILNEESCRDDIENLEMEIAQYKVDILKDITKLIFVKHQIMQTINELEDSRDRILLKLRYIDLKTWPEIAEEMCYSEMHIHRLHKNILNSINVS